MIGKFVLAAAVSVVAGTAIENGHNPRDWLTQSVVLAKVTSVTERYSRAHLVEFDIIATLTGPLDAAKEKHVSADGYFGESFTTQHVPVQGELVIVVLQKRDEGMPRYGVPGADIVTFMPDNAALMVVTGLDDPNFIKAVKTLGDLRKAHSSDKPAAKQ